MKTKQKHTYVLNALVKVCHISLKLGVGQISHDEMFCSSVVGVGGTCVVVRALSKIGYKYCSTIDSAAFKPVNIKKIKT